MFHCMLACRTITDAADQEGPRVQIYTPVEYTTRYAESGEIKAQRPIWQMLTLGILAGFLIAMGAAVANTAIHGVDDGGIARLVAGLLFPFGLVIVILTGAELFTGNTLMAISYLDRRLTVSRILRNWFWVYIGNAGGAIAVAIGCAYFGQLDLGNGQLALYTMKVAAAKSSVEPLNGFVLGFFCNVLVTIAVLVGLSAKDVAGRAIGAYMPVAFFVIAGFEHSIANLFYVPAGLFAASRSDYAEIAATAGMDLSSLTWSNFLANNLIPVTIGNIVAGVALGALFWAMHLYGAETQKGQAGG